MKNFMYVILGFIGIVGILGIGTVDANATVTHYTGSISYTLNSGFSTEKLFTGVGTIVISDCESGQTEDCTTITILDRNLGATVAGTGGIDSYGYHFQWGNNYGFKPCTDANGCKTFPNGESTGAAEVPVENISIPYSNGIFHVDITHGSRNWLNSPAKIDLWGGTANSTTDLFDSNGNKIVIENFEAINLEDISNYASSDDRKMTNAQERQGPCPDGFHVPSAGEYMKIADMLYYSNNQRQEPGILERIHNDLMIPSAGMRHLDEAGVYGFGTGAFLWSSSPYSTTESYSRYFGIISSELILGDFYDVRSNGYSIRCIYNSYDEYPKEITNIDISGIVEPLLGQRPVTGLVTVNTTPDNAITLGSPGYETSTIIWRHAPGFAQTLDNYRIGGMGHETFSSTTGYYYLRLIFTENSGYKVSDDVNVTANGKNLVRNVDFIGQTGHWYADFYAIKIYYPASELPIGIERVYLSGNILPLVHGTVPTKDITTDTTGITLGNITWGKGNDCEPLAENETIDASISKYCLSIDMITESGYATTFDYEIFLNGGHRIGYWDGDDAYACTPSLIINKNIVPQYKIEFISLGEIIGTRYRAHGCTLADCITYGDGLRVPNRPGYNFDGWFTDENFNTGWNWNDDQVVNNVRLYAKWRKDTSSNTNSGGDDGGSGGGGASLGGYSGGGKHTTTPTDTGGIGNYTDKNHSKDFSDAYGFAIEHGITTMDSLDEADMEGGLTRIAMAKMLSNYAVNVMGKKPVNKVVPNFPDINEELNEEYNGAVDLAYQLGIMGINIDEFRPFDLITRGEFGTALSRMLFGLADGDPYYVTHLAKLKEEGIMANIDPEMIEIRGYVMLMLKRSTKD